MVPPAPPTFSTTTVWPSGARMRSAMMRAVVSVEPPGGNGDTSVIGFVGKPCAPASPAAANSAHATVKRFIPPPSLECAPMLIDFFLKLKSHKLPVSIKEYLTLLEAMQKKVIGPSVDDF